jgi:hypothetical protein
LVSRRLGNPYSSTGAGRRDLVLPEADSSLVDGSDDAMGAALGNRVLHSDDRLRALGAFCVRARRERSRNGNGN